MVHGAVQPAVPWRSPGKVGASGLLSRGSTHSLKLMEGRVLYQETSAGQAILGQPGQGAQSSRGHTQENPIPNLLEQKLGFPGH